MKRIKKITVKFVFKVASRIFAKTLARWTKDLEYSGVFDYSYCLKPLHETSLPLFIGMEAKHVSPFHDFRPRSSFLERVFGESPFANHIAAEFFESRSTHEANTLDLEKVLVSECSDSTSIHVHVHEMNGAKDILERLVDQVTNHSLWITLTSTGLKRELVALEVFQLIEKSALSTNLIVVDNEGRDIWPWLSLPEVFWNSKVAVHVHTKSSKEQYTRWNFFLLENLLGSKQRHNLLKNIQHLVENPSVGIIFPRDPHILGWGRNYFIALKVSRALGFRLTAGPFSTFDFPVGNMFAYKSEYLKEVRKVLELYRPPSEPVPIDGTVLHALERTIPMIVEQGGGKVVFCHQRGVGREF